MENIKLDQAKELKVGYIYAPYILKTVKADINGEVVWHSNRFINLLLKIKHFFYKSKNLKRNKKYSKIMVDSSFYKTIGIKK